MFKSAISFAVVALLLAAPAGATDARRHSTVLPEPQPFGQTLTLQGVGFHVTSANEASENEVTIVPTGLSIDNAPIVRRVEGQVERTEVADLDRDGSPDIYAFLRSAAPGAHGSLLAFSANRRKSLSDIVLAPLADHAKASKGYRGQDEFAVVKHRLVRRFPVYKEGDTPGAQRRYASPGVQADEGRSQLGPQARACTRAMTPAQGKNFASDRGPARGETHAVQKSSIPTRTSFVPNIPHSQSGADLAWGVGPREAPTRSPRPMA